MITKSMKRAAAVETEAQQAAQWTPAKLASMRGDALQSAQALHVRRWGIPVATIAAEIASRSTAADHELIYGLWTREEALAAGYIDCNGFLTFDGNDKLHEAGI